MVSLLEQRYLYCKEVSSLKEPKGIHYQSMIQHIFNIKSYYDGTLSVDVVKELSLKFGVAYSVINSFYWQFFDELPIFQRKRIIDFLFKYVTEYAINLGLNVEKLI